MDYTQNYQLNQWDAADRVLREDFNSDNAKIDAALKALKDSVSIVTLADETLQTAKTQVNVDLSHTDLSPYGLLLIDLHPGTGSTQRGSCYLRCNGQSTGYQQGTSETPNLIIFGFGEDPGAALIRGAVVLLSAGLVGIPTTAYWSNDNFITTGTTCGTQKVNKATLHTLNFVMNSAESFLGAGTRIVIRGEKV